MRRYRLNGSRFLLDGHRQQAPLNDMLKWQFSGGRAKWPRWLANAAHPQPPAHVDGSRMLATWIGQSTVLIQTAGLNILTDPFFSGRASPSQLLGPKRVRPPGLAIGALPPIDIVLVSHNHYDHMDLQALKRIARSHRPRIVTPLGNARHIRKAGRELTVDELDWGGSLWAGNLEITLAPALHWSKRTPFDANRALWGAFVVKTPDGLIYFAGDTGYGDGATFRDVRRSFGSPRLSLLPIGAYEPRWFMKPQHMNPEEAVLSHLDLASRCSIAIHHATVQLTDEAIDAPVLALRKALYERAIDPSAFLVADVGEPIAIP